MAHFAEALSAQARIVWAVAVRDAIARNRTSPLGVLTALVEPLATISILALIISQVRMRVPEMGDYLVLFLMTAVIPITLFRAGAANVERAMIVMHRALVLPQLRPLDLMLGALLVHFVTLVALFLCLTVFFGLVFKVPMPENIMLALVPCIGNALLGLGAGAINLSIRTWFPFWSKIFGIVIGPIGIMSGLFYTASSMPESVQRILYYNPLMHSTEMCRSFYFNEFESSFFDPTYYFGWVFGVLFVGLACERLFRYRMMKIRL